MIIIIGLVILVAAVVVGVAGVLSDSGSRHALTHPFAPFRYHVTGSTGSRRCGPKAGPTRPRATSSRPGRRSRMPQGTDRPGQAVTGAGPAGAGRLYDGRCLLGKPQRPARD